MSLSFDGAKMTLIIIVVSIIGLNILFYLADRSIQPDVNKDINNVVQGSKQQIGKVDSALKEIEKKIDLGIKYNQNDLSDATKDVSKMASNVINTTAKTAMIIPDTILSEIQRQSKTRQSGYCFVGEDANGRNCTEIGQSQTCMSGDIFPTMDVCINPNLRV